MQLFGGGFKNLLGIRLLVIFDAADIGVRCKLNAGLDFHNFGELAQRQATIFPPLLQEMSAQGPFCHGGTVAEACHVVVTPSVTDFA